MRITDIDSEIPKRSRSYACKFPCNAGIRSTNFKDFHNYKSSMNNYIDRFAFAKGWKNEETNSTQSRVTRFQFLVLSSRRCLYTAVELSLKRSTTLIECIVLEFWKQYANSSIKLQRKCWFSNSLDFSSRCASFWKLLLFNFSWRANELSPLALRKSRYDKYPDETATTKLKKSLLNGHARNCGLQVFTEQFHFSIFLTLTVTGSGGRGGGGG